MDLDKLLDVLLDAFDSKIEQEKECRNEHKSSYGDGRVDGVDAGRYLVEKVFHNIQNPDSPIEN